MSDSILLTLATTNVLFCGKFSQMNVNSDLPTEPPSPGLCNLQATAIMLLADNISSAQSVFDYKFHPKIQATNGHTSTP